MQNEKSNAILGVVYLARYIMQISIDAALPVARATMTSTNGGHLVIYAKSGGGGGSSTPMKSKNSQRHMMTFWSNRQHSVLISSPSLEATDANGKLTFVHF